MADFRIVFRCSSISLSVSWKKDALRQTCFTDDSLAQEGNYPLGFACESNLIWPCAEFEVLWAPREFYLTHSVRCRLLRRCSCHSICVSIHQQGWRGCHVAKSSWLPTFDRLTPPLGHRNYPRRSDLRVLGSSQQHNCECYTAHKY